MGFSVLCLLCLCVRLHICAMLPPAGKGLGKGLTPWLLFVVYNCEFVTFPLVSLVRCGTWSYRFLIFAPYLTLSVFSCSACAVSVIWNQALILSRYFTSIRNCTCGWEGDDPLITKRQIVVGLLTPHCLYNGSLKGISLIKLHSSIYPSNKINIVFCMRTVISIKYQVM